MARGKNKGSLLTFVQKEKRKPKTKSKVDKTQCKNCLYRPPGRDELDITFGCFYILLMGHRRPSEPSPNCTVFKEYNREERLKMVQKAKEIFVTGKVHHG